VPGLALPRLFAHWTGLGFLCLGQFRRITPISHAWGFDRGLPIDRYYIEDFLAGRAEDIRGHVLEIMDATYTWRFGGKRVQKSDVLHASEGNPNATIVADLSRANEIPSATFDCIIFTQTLLFIYDVRSVIDTLHRILKPGGIVLGTVPGITKISREDMRRSGQYWSFTTLSIQRLLEEAFPTERVEVKAYGNVLTAAAFLYGLAAEELRKTELDHRDPDYEVIITFRAAKPPVSC
jgi:SAM-dependent methyltransferase